MIGRNEGLQVGGMTLTTYEDALALVRGFELAPAVVETVPRSAALGRVLARPLEAHERYPLFDNSAVDGYAVGCAQDSVAGAALRVVGASQAGAPRTAALARGECVRVLTGAMVPDGTFGIAMQEDVSLGNGAATLGLPVKAGRHIRRAGDDFFEGAVLLDAGSVLGAGAAALLACQGVAEVGVWGRPNAAVLVTGDELVDPDGPLPRGGVRESNGPMLAALLRGDGCGEIEVLRVPDSLEATVAAMARAVGTADLVVCAGGASVGDRDFVPEAVRRLGEIVFHGVSIRPGKPVLWGHVGQTGVFALPGNPASTFVTYALFVREAVRRLAGWSEPRPRWVSLPFWSAHEAVARDDFVRVRFRSSQLDEGTECVGEQGSFGVCSLARADALVRVPSGTRHTPGEPRPTLILLGT